MQLKIKKSVKGKCKEALELIFDESKKSPKYADHGTEFYNTIKHNYRNILQKMEHINGLIYYNL